MTPHIPEELFTRVIDGRPFVIMGNTMPPRDPDGDEEEDDEEDEEEEDDDEDDDEEERRADEPPVVREPVGA
jgi:hypothetical protein